MSSRCFKATSCHSRQVYMSLSTLQQWWVTPWFSQDFPLHRSILFRSHDSRGSYIARHPVISPSKASNLKISPPKHREPGEKQMYTLLIFFPASLSGAFAIIGDGSLGGNADGDIQLRSYTRLSKWSAALEAISCANHSRWLPVNGANRGV